MNIRKKHIGFLLLVTIGLMGMSFLLSPRRVTVYLAGDSTMADKQKQERPETGWGMPFKAVFDSTVTVVNKARNGRSTRTFISEGIWASIVDNLKPGDYVLIQFGHNDENQPRPEVYTPLPDYQANLERMIADVEAKQAIPVLITPVAQRRFDAKGQVTESHKGYADAVRSVAAAKHVALVDLDADSKILVQQYGPEDSKMLYNYIEAGEDTNYPDGRIDDTHFSELGARKVAEIVLRDIKSLKLELAGHIIISHFGTHF